MLYSINNTPDIKIYKEVPNDIIKKYSLNQKQIEVVNKAVCTRDTFYLQGPPGTGKTQTISAITNVLSNENKNVLMTSSTHEAISNFFDRLNELSNDNPNIIQLKYDSIERKKNNFTEVNLYKNFLTKINNFILKKDEKENKLLFNNINEILKNYPEIKDLTFISDAHVESIKLKIKNDQKFNDSDNWVIKEICNTGGYDNLETVKKDYDVFSFIDGAYKRFVREFFQKYRIYDEDDQNKLKEIFNKFTSYEANPVSINAIKKRVEKESSEIENILEAYLKTSENEKTLNEDFFKDYVFKNNLINVIGITTTSITEIKILDESKDLFLEYPIDTVIIDEISKSSTPEILARAFLAKKVIFAGDYKQLPPVNEIDNYFIEKIVKNDNKDFFKDFYEIFKGQKFNE